MHHSNVAKLLLALSLLFAVAAIGFALR